MCRHHLLLKEFSISCMTPLGEDTWKLVPGILWVLPHVPFPFADLALDPFATINLSYGYDYTLCSVESAKQITKLGVVLGTSNIVDNLCIPLRIYLHNSC